MPKISSKTFWKWFNREITSLSALVSEPSHPWDGPSHLCLKSVPLFCRISEGSNSTSRTSLEPISHPCFNGTFFVNGIWTYFTRNLAQPYILIEMHHFKLNSNFFSVARRDKVIRHEKISRTSTFQWYLPFATVLNTLKKDYHDFYVVNLVNFEPILVFSS